MRLLVAEDNETLREALKCRFDDDDEFLYIGSTSNVDEIVPLCLRHGAELVVLDIDLRGRPSLVELPQMCEAMPSVGFVIFSGHSDPAMIRTALKAGASAYVTKSARIEKLLEALRKVGGRLKRSWGNG